MQLGHLAEPHFKGHTSYCTVFLSILNCSLKVEMLLIKEGKLIWEDTLITCTQRNYVLHSGVALPRLQAFLLSGMPKVDLPRTSCELSSATGQ